MNSYRYRLTAMGWIGAALFVSPTPIAAWEWSMAVERYAKQASFDRLMGRGTGIEAFGISPMFMTALATASLVGFVLLLVGRELTAT